MSDSLQDPILGHLAWDKAMGWWVSEVDLFPGRRIEVFVDFDEEEPRERVLAQARLGLHRFREHEPEYRRWTASHLIERRWNTEEPMTVGDITELLRVASILFLQDGRARVYWDDEDVLFAGHNVTTELDASERCVSAGME